MNRWYGYLINAQRLSAVNTQKVNMIIVMMAGLTIFLAESIQNGVVGGGYLMNEAVLGKGLKRSVNGYPVKGIRQQFFNKTV